MVDLLHYESGIYAFDAGYLRPQLAAIHLIVERGRVAVVDTASNACLPRALAALRALDLSPTQVDYVFLTHVHLDHAGGAGAMMRAFPAARLVVHPRGARHMADPTPLFAAVQAVYGAAEAERLYGELLPVPADRIVAAGDGHALDLGGRTLIGLETPGHARHHLSLLDTRGGGIFAGEAFGISLRELDVEGRPSILPAVAPTQFDPAAMRASVERILSCQPPALYLAHFSRIRDVHRLGGDLLRSIEAQVALAERERDSGPERGARLLAGLWALVEIEAGRQGWRLAAEPLHALLDGYLELNARALDDWLGQTAPRPSGCAE
jgi:hydroxyacylglutathione hydrolase